MSKRPSSHARPSPRSNSDTQSTTLRLMKNRRYELVPLDEIVVLNSRNRDEAQFSENVRSIKDVGLLKPVVLNERFKAESGKYDLVCGEGRFLAHKRLGKKDIAAEIINCDRKQAYLISLIENIARVPAGTIWFAEEVQRMRDAGMPIGEIGRIVGKSEASVAAYIRLADRGDERLIRGVEQGVFSMTFALRVAESSSTQVQHVLMDAFDNNMITSANLNSVRRIITAHFKNYPKRLGRNQHSTSKQSQYSVDQLKQDIARICKEKEAFVREAGMKEGRLISLVENMKTARADEKFMALLKAEGLAELPELKSMYRVE